MLRRLFDWFRSRCGWDELWNRWMRERVPSRINWLYTLGSLSLFFLIVQLLTGIVLSLYYAPTPQAAYASVRYIQYQVFLGGLVRALHHWGASFMVIVVFLHMARVFVHGSYKAPRELTWISGVLLLLLVLGFGFTGYLLPWDQKAYWGTVVGTNIAGLAPGLGNYVADFLRGGSQVGAMTLTRFYALHVMVLPALIIALVVAHLALMRRHGITAPPKHESDPEREEFYPRYAARDATVIFVAFTVLIFLSLARPAPLEAPADLNASGSEPKPDWYFLALYQLLKYFPGKLEILGAVVIPTLVLLALLALPFLDRKPERRISARKSFAVAGALFLLCLAVLTFVGGRGDSPAASRISIGEISGAYFFSEKCASCHQLDSLKAVPDDVWIQQHAGARNVQLASSPRISTRVAGSLSAYLQARPRLDFGREELHGAGLFILNSCGACHTLLGTGGISGPALDRVGSKRDKKWMIEHFKDPEKLVPNSKMPAFDYLSDQELADLSDFLLRFK